MAEIQVRDCPLCGNPASCLSIGRGHLKRFVCAACTDFVISKGAEKRLADDRSGSIQMADIARRAPQGFMLEITLPVPRSTPWLRTRWISKPQPSKEG